MKGTENAAGKTRQDIKRQIKWEGLTLKLLGTRRYILGTML